MQCWINGPATGGIDDKIKMAIILLKTNIPAFHHSIIPFSGPIRKPQGTSTFSVGCRNSETLNMSCCALSSRLDTSATAFYNCLIIINYTKFTREVIHYGAN